MKTAKSMESLSNAASAIAQRIITQQEQNNTNGEHNNSVYIHCGGGVGRAGLMAACVLGVLYKDLTAEEALQYTTGLCQLRNLEGMTEEEHKHYSSPETDGQKDQVREFFQMLRSEK